MKFRKGFPPKSLILIFSAFILLFISAVSSTRFQRKSSSSVLTISVYYETKCGGSSDFINNQVSKVIESFPHVVNIDLIPYGNANVLFPSCFLFL